MKKKITIIAIIIFVLLVSVFVYTCANKKGKANGPESDRITEESKEQEESDASESDSENATSEEKQDSKDTVPEDKVTLDYGAVDDEIDRDAEENSGNTGNTSGGGNSTTPDAGNSDPTDDKLEQNTGSSSSGNPYDKDGDGFVDGWY